MMRDPMKRLAAEILRRYGKPVDIEFDSAKDAINREKHGVSLAFGGRVFDDPAHLLISSYRPHDDEERFKVIGVVDDKMWAAVHVRRGNGVRFISVRRSNDDERRAYRGDQGRSE